MTISYIDIRALRNQQVQQRSAKRKREPDDADDYDGSSKAPSARTQPTTSTTSTTASNMESDDFDPRRNKDAAQRAVDSGVASGAVVRYTAQSEDDITRLFAFLFERNYRVFHGSVSCGHLHSPFRIYPCPSSQLLAALHLITPATALPSPAPSAPLNITLPSSLSIVGFFRDSHPALRFPPQLFSTHLHPKGTSGEPCLVRLLAGSLLAPFYADAVRRVALARLDSNWYALLYPDSVNAREALLMRVLPHGPAPLPGLPALSLLCSVPLSDPRVAADDLCGARLAAEHRSSQSFFAPAEHIKAISNPEKVLRTLYTNTMTNASTSATSTAADKLQSEAMRFNRLSRRLGMSQARLALADDLARLAASSTPPDPNIAPKVILAAVEALRL